MSIRLAASTRLILAMLQLAASIEEGLGKGLMSLIQKYFPDQKLEVHPATVGHKLMAIVRKEVQGDPTRAMDVIQEWLTYMVERNQDFSKDFDNPQKALEATYTNLRRRGISESMGHMRRKKRTKNVDDAFGKRGEGGDAPSGGEGMMPTPDSSALGKALDEKASIKEFVDMLDDHMSDLRSSLTDDSRALFDLVFEDNEGSFSSDIKENMNQASRMKEKHPEIYEKHQKRWSGFIGDLRKKLLQEIWNYIDHHLTQQEYDILKDTFFGDTDASYIRKQEKITAKNAEEEQQGKDERKISRYKWQEENGNLEEKDKKSFENLKVKLKKSGIDVDKIIAEENPSVKKWKIQKPSSSKAASMFNEAAIALKISSLQSSYWNI